MGRECRLYISTLTSMHPEMERMGTPHEPSVDDVGRGEIGMEQTGSAVESVMAWCGEGPGLGT
jgi:hypothetical protein